MNALVVAVVSAATSLLVSIISLWLGDRQRERGERRTERRDLNARYLNPTRMYLVENHFRLAGTVRRVQAEGGTCAAMLVVERPEELSEKDADWFNGTGCALVSSVYLTACLFAHLKQVRDDFPYLRLSGADDTRLAALILSLQHGYLRDDGIFYVTQPSIGEDMWLRDQGRLRTYREFCTLLGQPGSRVWFDRLVRFHLDTARGIKLARAEEALAALRVLTDFLDGCVGGGRSIGSRWASEGLDLT